MSYELENEIENILVTDQINHVRPTADEIGKAYRIDDALGRYIVFCKNTFPSDTSLAGLKIVLDCANGATYKAAPIIFSELGAEIITIHNKPDGKNINANCGSQFTDDLIAKVKETNSHLGLAFDGDGDRLIAIDEKGQELTGDHILVICSKFAKEQKQNMGNAVVITPMSNFGMRVALREMGIKYIEAEVGDRNVLETMQKSGCFLGGEQSGHLIFLHHHTTGDGIISALQLLAVMQKSGKTLSELAQAMNVMPQKLVNVKVSRKPPIKDIPELCEAIHQAETQLADNGRVLIRYSGTEPLCRIMVEGPTEEITGQLTQSLSDTVTSLLS